MIRTLVYNKLCLSHVSKTKRSISSLTNTVSIISVPFNLGQPHLGPDLAPSLLFERGLTKQLGDCGWQVKSLPPISKTTTKKSDVTAKAKNIVEVGTVCERVKLQIESETTHANNFILTLGGDHCIALGTIPGVVSKRPNTGIVWVDAHADINTPSSSSSGNMHGMPVGFLLGLVDEIKEYPSMAWLQQKCIDPKDIVYIGLRDVDGPERKTLKKLGIKAFSMFEVDKYGIGKIMDMTLEHLAAKDNIHLSFDIDALDPFFAPSTGTAVRGGLTFREGNYICEVLSESGKLSSMDIVEVNPSLHSDLDAQQTLDVSLSIIRSAMGQTILERD